MKVGVINVQYSYFMFGGEGVRARSVLFSNFRVGFLLKDRRYHVRHLLQRSYFYGSGVNINTSSANFCFFSRLRVLPCRVRRLSRRLIPLVLRGLVTACYDRRLLFLLHGLRANEVRLY